MGNVEIKMIQYEGYESVIKNVYEMKKESSFF